MNTLLWKVALVAPLLATCVAGAAHAQGTVSVTRKIEIQYDLDGAGLIKDGLPKKEIVEPDDSTLRVTTEYTRDARGAVLTRTTAWQDPIGGAQGEGAKSRVETLTWDAQSRFVTAARNARSHEELRTWDAGSGNLVSVTDPNLLTTSWQYDGWGRKVRESRPDGTATSWAYRQCTANCGNGAVFVTITQQWHGSAQTSVPAESLGDSLGRPVAGWSWSLDGTPVLSERQYDAHGRLQRVARPRFSAQPPVWTLYQRDPIGRVEFMRSPNAAGSGDDVTRFAYSGLGVTITNAKNQTRTERRNGLGKLSRATDHLGYTTRYLYDPFGNLTRTTDPKGNQINVEYDRLGRKTRLIDPDLGTWSYVVDPVGQTRQQTDAKGQVTFYRFDELGRMTQRLEPDLDSRWEYDGGTKGIGKLTEAYTWVAGTKDYRRVHAYDNLGRRSSVTISLDWDYRSDYAYDGFARPEWQCHYRMPRGGGANAVNCIYPSYNAQGYLSQWYRWDGASTLVWQALQQDGEGRITREQLGNGLRVERSYNAYTGRLQTLTSGASAGSATHQNDSYAYDAIGNLTSRSQLASTSGAQVNETFGYDDLNRLTSSTVGSTTRTVSYDAIGNITAKGGVGTYGYPPTGAQSSRPHAVTSIAGNVAGLTNPAFTYDANGNLLEGLGRSYAWTSFNQPQRIDKLSGASAVQRTGFDYGPAHERVRQTVTPLSGGLPGAPSSVIWYAGAIEKEIDQASGTTIVRTALPMGLGFIEERIAGTSVAPAASATRQPRWRLRDHLGSTIALADAAQAVLQRLSYDAWGRRRQPDGSDDPGAGWGSLANPHDHSGYTGHEHLDQLGLVHMNARLYDPIVARHTSADPGVPDAADTQSLNRYAYVLNNALAFTDPTGLSPNPVFETIDSRPRWGHAAIAAGLVESASPWGGGGIAGGAEDTSGTVQRLGLWHAAMMLGRHDPTFWDDLEAMRHDVLVAGSTLAERSRALLWAGGVRESDMNLVTLSVLEEVMERAAASPSRGPPVLLASADEHWSPESNRQGLSDTAGDRAGVAVLGSTLLLTTGAVAAPAVVAVYRSASAVAMLRSAAAVKESLKGVQGLTAAAAGKTRSSGDIVVQGGRNRAKELFREFDVKGAGNRTIGRDKTGGGRSVEGALEDGTPLRIRMKPDGTTRIQAGDQKFIFPSR